MKEPFYDMTDNIANAKAYSDLELMAYLADDDTKNSFIGESISNTIQSVGASKSSKFNDLYDQATGADNNVTAAAYYTARTLDLKNLASDVDTMAVNQLNVAGINKGLAGRQAEINEWSNFNKLDTLYCMQILFICLTLVAILALFRSTGTITNTLFSFMSFMLAALGVLMLVLRWRYTNVNRDGRYWHKSRFQKQVDKSAAQSASAKPTI